MRPFGSDESTHEDATGGRHLDEEVYRRGATAPDPRKPRSNSLPLNEEDTMPKPRLRRRHGRGSDGNRNNAAKRNSGRCRSN